MRPRVGRTERAAEIEPNGDGIPMKAEFNLPFFWNKDRNKILIGQWQRNELWEECDQEFSTQPTHFHSLKTKTKHVFVVFQVNSSYSVNG